MKKKRLLKLFIALAVVVVIVILSSTVFTLKKVELCFYDSSNKLIEDYEAGLTHFSEEDTKDIIKSGEFKYGKSIFFIKRQPSIDKIEAKYPYIKIIGISATFPDGFKIKAMERQPMYSILLPSGKAVILDEELKVLEIKDTISKFDYIAVYNSGVDNASPGTFLTGDNDIKTLKKLGTELFANKFEKLSSVQHFESVRVENNSHFTKDPAIKCSNLIIKTRDYGTDGRRIAGVRIEIENITSNFELKLNKALSYYNELIKNSDPNAQRGTIKAYDNLTVAYF